MRKESFKKTSYCLFLFTALLILFSGVINQSHTFAQVQIRERVEVEPKDLSTYKGKLDATYGASTATFKLILTGAANCENGKASCRATVTGTSFSGINGISAVKENTAGYYEWAVSFSDDRGVECNGSYSLQIYYADSLVYSNSGPAIKAFGWGYTSCGSNYTYLRGVNASTSEWCGIGQIFSVGVQSDHNLCEGGEAWTDSTVTVGLQTSSAEFYNIETESFIGPSVSFQYGSDLGKYRIISKIPADSPPQTATINVSMGSKSGSHEFALMPISKFSLYGKEYFCITNTVSLQLTPYCYENGQPDNYLSWFDANIRIVKGSELVSFYKYNQEIGNFDLIGDNIIARSGDLWDYNIRVDSNEPPDDTTEVVVEYEILNTVQKDTLLVYPPGSPFIEAFLEYEGVRHNETTEMYLMLNRDGCSYPFPDTTSFKVSIVDGADLGWLIDVNGSGAKGKSLDLQIFDNCCAYLRFDATGFPSGQTDTAVFKIEYENAEPVYLYLEVRPSDLRISFNPAVISPGDTANIIVETYNHSDEQYEPLPPGDMVEVGVLGCEFGQILLSDGSKDFYFKDVLQPIRFIADTAIDMDNMEVPVRVGIDAGWWKPIKGGDDSLQKKSLPANDTDSVKTNDFLGKLNKIKISDNTKAQFVKKFNKFISSSPTSIKTCPAEFEYFMTYDVGQIGVRKKCSSLDNCFGIPYPEFVQYKFVPNGFPNPQVCQQPDIIDPATGVNIVQVGGFKPLEWRYNASQKVDVSPCFDNINNKVRFNLVLTDMGTNQISPILKPEAILEICKYNIRNAGFILIESPEELLNIIRQYPDQIPIIRNDMDNTLATYGGRVKKYKFMAEILAHENEHKKDYEMWFNNLKLDWFDNKINNYTINCDEYKANDQEAAIRAQVEFLLIITSYIKKSIAIATQMTDEMNLHKRNSVQASLGEYYSILFKFENGLIF